MTMDMHLNATHDATRRSWLDSANDPRCDFPLQNLPFAVVRRAASDEPFRGAVAIGDQALDLAALAATSLFAEPAAHAVTHEVTHEVTHDVTHAARPGLTQASWHLARQALRQAAKPALNDFLAMGAAAHHALRRALFELLASDAAPRSIAQLQRCLIPLDQVEYAVPVTIGDYTDFYTSIDHARNVMGLLKPGEPLGPNFQWMPIAYHGRVSSIGVSGQHVIRPQGQFLRPGDTAPVRGPCMTLDYEMELGVYIAKRSIQGHPIDIHHAEDHAFGMCLLNDWSARDVQWWEMAPLGPFQSKNFATTVSPWIVTLEALAPFRTAWHRPDDEPQPLAYLDSPENRERGGIDIHVEVWLETAAARAAGAGPAQLSGTRFCHQYWSIAQMITHHTSGGCNLNVGDLLGSGTISGPGETEAGALIERSRNGQRPVDVGHGEHRSFVEDGDAVMLRGWCERPGFARIGFGESRGEVLPAHKL